MEVLGALITDKCQTNLWNVILASKGGISFSHLFFIDDLVLFAKVDCKNCVVVRDALDTFCDLFGQKVSDEKSRVFFSPNISQHTRKELCSILKFQSTPSLGKYLDFLLSKIPSICFPFFFFFSLFFFYLFFNLGKLSFGEHREKIARSHYFVSSKITPTKHHSHPKYHIFSLLYFLSPNFLSKQMA